MTAKVTEKKPILLDKSYLQGAPSLEVQDLCGGRLVLMNETLFFETLLSKPRKRRSCFSKLMSRENPVLLVPHMGTLIRGEVNERRACGPVESLKLSGDWHFNGRILDDPLQLTVAQQAGVNAWRGQEEGSLEQFLETAKIAYRTFPALRTLRAGDTLEVIRNHRQAVARDRDGLLEFYENTRPPGFPPASSLDDSWAVFRWYQVQAMAAGEFYIAHHTNWDVDRKKVLNEVRDLDYTAVALLVGAIASRDKTIIERFKTLEPDGEVVS